MRQQYADVFLPPAPPFFQDWQPPPPGNWMDEPREETAMAQANDPAVEGIWGGFDFDAFMDQEAGGQVNFDLPDQAQDFWGLHPEMHQSLYPNPVDDGDEDLSDLADDEHPVGDFHAPPAPNASDEIPASSLQQTWPQQIVTDRVFDVFPDISRKHVSELYEKQSKKFVDERLCQVIYLSSLLVWPTKAYGQCAQRALLENALIANASAGNTRHNYGSPSIPKGT